MKNIYMTIRSDAYNGALDTAIDTAALGVFWAFSNQEFEEGLAKHGYTVDQIVSIGGGGGYGNSEAVKKFHAAIEAQERRVFDIADPQKVYHYEYWNHECDYYEDDKEAACIVLGYFGIKRAERIGRRNAIKTWKELEAEMIGFRPIYNGVYRIEVSLADADKRAWYDPPEPKAVYTCEHCGDAIVDGAMFLLTNGGKFICEDCADNDIWYVLEKYFDIYKRMAGDVLPPPNLTV